jgi:hypothetical protein
MSCVICLEALSLVQNNAYNVVSLHCCKNEMHKSCFVEWLIYNHDKTLIECCLCRKNVSNDLDKTLPVVDLVHLTRKQITSGDYKVNAILKDRYNTCVHCSSIEPPTRGMCVTCRMHDFSYSVCATMFCYIRQINYVLLIFLFCFMMMYCSYVSYQSTNLTTTTTTTTTHRSNHNHPITIN